MDAGAAAGRRDLRPQGDALGAAALLTVASLVAILVMALPSDCEIPTPTWLFGIFVFTFTVGLIWATATLASVVGVPDFLAMPLGIGVHLLIGLVGWGVFNAFAEDDVTHQAIVWFPLWIIGVLFGTDAISFCGD